MTSASPTAPAQPDLWHRYGRGRAAADRAMPERLYWNWGQDGGPGAEILGDLNPVR